MAGFEKSEKIMMIGQVINFYIYYMFLSQKQGSLKNIYKLIY